MATASMVGRNERMWHRRESGRLLILLRVLFWAIASEFQVLLRHKLCEELDGFIVLGLKLLNKWMTV